MKRSLVALVVAMCWSMPAHASTTEEHRALMVAGQLMRSDGKLLRAREVLRDCASQSCDGGDPECATIRRYCEERVADVERELPSLRIEVVDDLGRPMPFATVELAGRAVRHGALVAIDPGPWTLKASWLGRVGTVDGVAAREVHEARARVTVDLRVARTARPMPWLVPALAAVAAVGAATFAGLGTATLVQQSDLAKCEPTCAWSRREPYTVISTGTDIALGVTLAAAAGAVIAWLTRPTVIRVERLGAEVR